jgi:hypothetical protein
MIQQQQQQVAASREQVDKLVILEQACEAIGVGLSCTVISQEGAAVFHVAINVPTTTMSASRFAASNTVHMPICQITGEVGKISSLPMDHVCAMVQNAVSAATEVSLCDAGAGSSNDPPAKKRKERIPLMNTPTIENPTATSLDSFSRYPWWKPSSALPRLTAFSNGQKTAFTDDSWDGSRSQKEFPGPKIIVFPECVDSISKWSLTKIIWKGKFHDMTYAEVCPYEDYIKFMWKRVAGDKPPVHGQVLDLLLFSAACHRDSKVGHIACDHPEFTEYLRCDDISMFRFPFITFMRMYALE